MLRLLKQIFEKLQNHTIVNRFVDKNVDNKIIQKKIPKNLYF